MERVNVYIDGFNFYYGLKSKWQRKYYWLDIVKFFKFWEKDNKVIQDIFYFTSKQNKASKRENQKQFIEANLYINSNFKVVWGKYIMKEVVIEGKAYQVPEEKQTDVNIAIAMINGVVFDHCDITILVSADSDLLPAINFIKNFNPDHKIFVMFPPKRFSTDLQHAATTFFNLDRYEERFKKSILPNEIEKGNGHKFIKPAKWG